MSTFQLTIVPQPFKLPDHNAIGHIFAIQIPDVSSNGMPTVHVICYFREQNELVFSKITILDKFLLKIEMNDAYDATTELCDLWNPKQELMNEMEKL